MLLRVGTVSNFRAISPVDLAGARSHAAPACHAADRHGSLAGDGEPDERGRPEKASPETAT